MQKKRANSKKQLSRETAEKRQERLAKKGANNKEQLSRETAEKRQERLAKMRANNKKQLSQETTEKRQERLAKIRANQKKQLSTETDEKRQQRLAKRRANYKKTILCAKEREERLIDSPIHEQTQAKHNIDMFHNSNIYTVYQCSLCQEAWPINFTPRLHNQYQCSRCTNDKELPKKFSKENSMIPS